MVKFSEILQLCIRDNTSHSLCASALELASIFNSYYNHKDQNGKSDTSVKNAGPSLREAHLRLVMRVADAIKEVLEVLGIDAPETMRSLYDPELTIQLLSS